MGFDSNGVISALDCKAWCLAGAFMDLAWNDLYGVMTGLDMVTVHTFMHLAWDELYGVMTGLDMVTVCTFIALHLSKCKLCTFVAVSTVMLLEQ